jgi:hypothetical protein
MGSIDHINDPVEKTVLKNDKFWVSEIAGRGIVRELCGYNTGKRAGFYRSKDFTVYTTGGVWVLQSFEKVDNNNDWTYNNYSYCITGEPIDRDKDLAVLLLRNEEIIMSSLFIGG